MNTAELYRLMENPSSLSEETLPVLKQIVDDFPYFHTARMLYLKNLAVLNDICFGSELKKMAVHIPDRKKMFVLVKGELYGLKTNNSSIKDDFEKDDSFSLIEAFLSSSADDNGQQTENTLLFQPSVSSDYIYWSLSETDEKHENNEPVAKLQHHDLIDSFIKNEEQRIPGSGLNIESADESLDISDSSDELEEAHLKPLDDSYFTETLAHIYVKQKRYEKALQINKNLNLKYPEKNIYFADQIRFLEKLIINTKK